MTASLIPEGRQSYQNATGAPLVGGKLYTYLAGTNTPAPTWSDPAQTVVNTNPIILDARGEATIFWNGNYKIVLRDANDALVWTQDNVTAYDVGELNVTKADLAATSGASLVGYNLTTSYPAGTVGRALQPFNRSNTFLLNPLGATSPSNGSYFGLGGNALSFTTLVSTPTGRPDADNQRAQVLFASTTTDDGNSEEQNLCLLTTIKTGYAKPWTQSTAFAVGDNIRNQSANTVYRCVTAGTSAATGTGPSSVANGIVDGTVVWNWINDSAIDAKVGLYNEVLVLPSAGNSWAQANNIEIKAGVLTDFVINTEFDLTNNCGVDSQLGGLNKYNLLVTTQGANRSTAGIEVNTTNTSNFAAYWGLHFSGAKLATSSVIGVDASSNNGLSFGIAGGGTTNPTFTDSVINDSSNALKGIKLSGNYSSSGIESGGTAPASYVSNGTKSLAGIFEASTTPTGLVLQGSYSVAQINGNGFRVRPDGGLICTLGNYANDGTAGAAGVAIGQLYHNAGAVRIRLT